MVQKLAVALDQLSAAVKTNVVKVQWTCEAIEKRGVPIVNNQRLIALVRLVAVSRPESSSSAQFAVHDPVIDKTATRFANMLTVIPSGTDAGDTGGDGSGDPLSKALQLAATLDWFAGIL